VNTSTSAARRKLTRYHRAKGGSATTPPDRAAAHIAHLRQHGMIDRDIRTAAHIAEPTLYRAARRQGAISRDTEQRILAVQPATPGRARSLATIPPHSTRRRLQALVHAGWKLIIRRNQG